MAPKTDEKSIEVRDSIEAKGANDDDVEMEDAGNQMDVDADAEVDADGEEDADGEPDDAEPSRSSSDPKNLLQVIDNTSQYLCNYTEEGEEIAAGFQRIPNKRLLPDYFDVIAEPIAFSTIRGKVIRKSYTDFSEFVRDAALIFHNAQVYNRPSAPIFQYAVRLREVLKEKLQELVADGTITAKEAELPDFGELPPVDDSPPPEAEEDEDVDEDEEDEEDDEDEDDSDDEDGHRRRSRRRARQSSGKKDADDEDGHKKRGRPPKVFTPMEARINAVLKGLRKFKNEDGSLRIVPFEKLPDKLEHRDYYATIKNPLALDMIKKKAKRKKYRSVDEVMVDVDLMFKNAIEYNEEGSAIYEDAVELQKQAHIIADQEKAKPDEAFRDDDGKLPLSEIQSNGETWKVGDWVHIRNPNDLSKPIVAQIYRLWQDESGQKWVNACWYYRPEQTVHRFEKHFFENEVVKTGQYRDHRVEEIVDRCFVMFITRYHRGRPRGFPPDKEVYVCEARYNEEKFKFNKIKTWTSCVPDEVREKDYEMDLFDPPRKVKKVPSPIKHLLQSDAKESDPLPKPTWGSPNAPPIIGAVHRRPREANESPPPEPTPEPPVIPPASLHTEPIRRQSTQDVSMSGSPAGAFPHAAPVPPSPSPGHYGQAHFAPRPTPTPPTPVQIQPMAAHSMHSPAQMPPTPHYAPQGYPQQYAPAPSPVGHHQQIPTPLPYDHHRMTPNPAAMTPQRMPMAAAPPPTGMAHTNAYNPPRPVEVYTLPDGVDASIPPEYREQFHHDDQGRILFFTAPPLNRPHPGIAPESAGLGHSVAYLADKQQRDKEREKKRKEKEEFRETVQRKKVAYMRKRREEQERDLWAQAGNIIGDWVVQHKADTERLKAEVAPFEAEKEAWLKEKQELAEKAKVEKQRADQAIVERGE